MDPTTSHARARLLALVVPMLVAGLWVGLTWHTGLTYHFMPLAIGVSGTALARWTGSPVPRRDTTRLAAWSLLVIALGWAAMAAGDFRPTATFISDQPGGVIGEVIAFGVLGALWSARYALRD